jgi:hypothetical protein
MRFITSLLTPAGMLLATASTALAAPLAMLQDPPIRVEVETAPTREVWYTSPMWLAIGAIVVLLIIVLAVVSARGREGSNTTVVR